jgi:glycosyltransferase involved in cell wall biosynthesis
VNGTTHDMPDYVDRLRQRASTVPGLDFRLNGPYAAETLPVLLQAADVAVVPSQVPETFALVAREALLLGVPILVSRLGALPEAIEAGCNGLAFDPFNPLELARHLRALWEDEALYARLRRGAEQSRVVVSSEHARRLQEVFMEITARPLPPVAPAAFEELGALRQLLVANGFA